MNLLTDILLGSIHAWLEAGPIPLRRELTETGKERLDLLEKFTGLPGYATAVEAPKSVEEGQS